MLAVAAAVLAGALAVPVLPAEAAAPCTPAAAATYRHSFTGPRGTMTVTARQPLCRGERQGFALASYTVSGSGSFIFDRATGTITSTNRSLTLNVDIPPCSAQVAGVVGAVPTELFGTVPPGLLKNPATWHAGGGPGCSPTGTVTFVSSCDGTFQARLTNPGGMTAVFLHGERLIRVRPGRSTTLRGESGSTMTIRASSFTTYVGGWRRPATGCTGATTTVAPPPVASTGPASPGAVPSGVRATSLPALVEPSIDAQEPGGGGGGLVPEPTTVAATAVAKADEGMSTGSIIAIGIGLLMIVGGSVALTYLVRELRRPG